MFKTRSILMISGLILMAFLLAACGGLAGEPEIVGTVVPPTVEPVVYPPQPPNLANGAKLFADNCTACHGKTGDGQGENVLSGKVPAMPSFLDSDHVGSKRPDEYFSMITSGNLEKLMPPWKDALTVQERWDVAMFVYTMRYQGSELGAGANVYAAECARCHGEDGKGGGVDMIGTGRTASDMSDTTGMLALSDKAMLTTVREGVGETMPAYQGQLSEEDMRAVVEYSRGFSVTSAVLPEGTAEALPASVKIAGTVTNGTAGGTVPDNLTVYLRYGASGGDVQTLQTTMNADKTFSFADVPVIENAGYIVLAVYQDRLFTGKVMEAAALKPDNDGSFSIYEATDDPQSVVIRRIELDIEPHEVESIGAGLIFSERIIYENTTDRMYALPPEVSGGEASVVVQLPPGAIIISTDDPTRYVTSDDKGLVVDTMPVVPGEHIVQVIYFLPYQNGAIFDQPQTHAIDGDMTINIAPTSLTVHDDRLTLQPNPDNSPYNTYSGAMQVPFSGTLRFNIEGAVAAPQVLTNQNPGVVTSDNLLPIILVGVIVLTGVFGLMIVMIRRSTGVAKSKSDREIRLLIRQIAELDEMHSAGQINHDVYQRQRQDLKAQLANLMSAGKTPEAKTSGEESAGS